jgi:hypothetical protein
MRRQFPLSTIVIIGLVLSVIGWGGLVFLINYTLPTIGPRWFFYFLCMLALSGTFLPIIAYLHRRFSGNRPVGLHIVVRQTIWIALYGTLLSWIQSGGAMESNRAIFLALGFFLVEVLLRLLERSRWKPGDKKSE